MFVYCGNNPVLYFDPHGNYQVPGIWSCGGESTLKSTADGVILSNYVYNSKNDQTGLIYNQNASGVCDMRYGNYTLSYNGCGAIALHNATIMSGQQSSLANVIQYLGVNRFMWSPFGNYAAFGTAIRGIAPFLYSKGLDYTVYYEDFDAVVPQEGDVYIMSYFLKNSLGVHTVAMEYGNGMYNVYNRFSNSTGVSSVGNLSEIPSGGRIIVLFEIG